MSRKSLSLAGKGVRKRKSVRHKQSGPWQTSINSYFGGKSLPIQPTLSHFIQKSKASTSQSSARLPLSLDQITLNDRDNPSSNPELPTISSVALETISEAESAALHRTGIHGELKHSMCRRLKSENDESCVSPQNTKCTTGLHEESQNLTPLETECDEKFEPTECSAEDQSPPRSQIEVFTMKPSARPPLSEVLVEPSLVKFKTGLNPFAKLNPQSASSPVVSHSPASSVVNELGPSVRKTGLSLKIRKRKFVMSPSKPRQEKPVKQVMKVDENTLSSTPPLFATPSHSHISRIPTLTSPSLFSPGDRDLLQQYSTVKTTPCRRLSLADLEGASVCGAVVSDGEIVETYVAKSSDTTKENADLQPTDFSFSLFDDVLDQSSCDVPSKPHDVTARSHDLFDQSHDSFDELLRQASNNSLLNPTDTNEVTTSDGSLGLGNDITRGSHDLSRHLVLEAVVQEWDGGGGGVRARPELMLRLLDQSTLKESVVHLRDEWFHITISPGDTVQINPPPEWRAELQGDSPCVIDFSSCSNVIVSPDLLITPTAIATSVTCPRRAILSDIFKGISKDSVPMVTGNLLHQVLQGLLVEWAESDKRVSTTDIGNMMRVVLSTPESLNNLYSLGISDDEALSLLSPLSPALHDWCTRFLQPHPTTPDLGEIEFKRNACDGDGKASVSVTRVLDIEENVWSPRLGLKGKVDATLQIKMKIGKDEECCHRVPLEIKTGKMYRKQGSLEHRAQLSLYSVMLRDRYSDASVPGGLLYYMKAGHMHGLPAEDHDIRSLLMARNSVAANHGKLASNMTLPGMLRDSHVCKYCPHLPQCSLAHKSLEQGTEVTSGLGDLFQSHTHHLSQKHLDFFSHWTRLVLREEGRGRDKGENFWKFTAHYREKEGLAMANMLAHPPVRDSGTSSSRHLQKFTRQPSSPLSPSSSLTHPHTLTLNERVVVSRQDGTSWAVAMGIVTVATDSDVELSLDKPVACDGREYRLDVAPSHRGSSASLVNLARLCSSDSERDAELRSIIIDLQPPRFHTSPHPKGNPDSESTSGLNLNQISALNKVLSSKDYCLILGRPGTGKTTTISKLVQTMVGRGASVLVTSYTHSAVDNILLKLKEVVVSVHLYILMISLFTSASVHHSIFSLFCCPTLFGNALVGNVHTIDNDDVCI